MVDTVHEVTAQEVRSDTTPLTASSLKLVVLDSVESDVQPDRRIATIPKRHPLTFGLAVFLVSFGLAAPLWHWAMTYDGAGSRFTPATDLLIAAVILGFGVPELVLAIRRWRSHSRNRMAAGN
jgi:hypothetical protein